MNPKLLIPFLSIGLLVISCGKQPEKPRAVLNPAGLTEEPVSSIKNPDVENGDTIVVQPIAEEDLIPIDDAEPIVPAPVEEDRIGQLPLELQDFVKKALEEGGGKNLTALDETWNLDSFKAIHNSSTGAMSIGGTLTVHKKALGVGVPGESMHFIVLIDEGTIKEFSFKTVNKGDLFRKIIGPIATVISAYFGAPIPVDGIIDIIDELVKIEVKDWQDKAKSLATIISLELYHAEQKVVATP